MPTVTVERTIDAPIERVFDLLTDHANYEQFPGITRSELVREGEPGPNGLGALRRIATGPIRFEEEITAFERPTRMDYLILDVNVPLDHDGGSITLEAAGDATRVLWTSTFRLTVPGIGGMLGPVAASALKRGFDGVLKDIERRLSRR